MAQRAMIIAAARSYLDTRWRHQGRSRLGIDCGGLLVCVTRDCGIPITDTLAYGRQPHSTQVMPQDEKALRQILGERFDEISRAALLPGDVVLLGLAGTPAHVGIVSDLGVQGWGLIHASAELVNRRVVEHRLDEPWRRLILGCYRFRGVED